MESSPPSSGQVPRRERPLPPPPSDPTSAYPPVPSNLNPAGHAAHLDGSDPEPMSSTPATPVRLLCSYLGTHIIHKFT